MKYTTIVLLTGLIFSSTAIASDLPEFPFVHATGTAITNVAPDRATITLTINHYNETASNATAVVEEVGGKLISSLSEKYNIPASAITAHDINKTPTHRRGDKYELLEIMGYTVSRNVSVEIRDIDSFPVVMRYVAELDNVTNVDADFRHSNKKVISRSLTAQACRNARNDAELLAEASGVSLGGLFAISTDGFASLESRFKPYISDGNLYGDSLMGDVKLDLPFFAPDTVKYKATVATIYKLN